METHIYTFHNYNINWLIDFLDIAIDRILWITLGITITIIGLIIKNRYLKGS